MRIWIRAMCAWVAAGCASPTPGEQPFRDVFPTAASLPTASPARHVGSAGDSGSGPTRADCAAELARLRALAALPGAPALERRRAEVLARAKAEPVLFVRAPEYTEPPTAEVERYRRQLARRADSPYALHRVYGRFGRRPEVARAVLLRDGYLYADTPGLGISLVQRVKLHHLFRAPELVIHRGSERLRVVKQKKHYVYADGPESGERARMLLFDRVWPAGTEPGPPLHVDLRALSDDTGADRIRVERITTEGIVAELRYAGTWVPSVLSIQGAKAALRCELLPAGAEAEVAHARDFAWRRQRALRPVRAAVARMVDESLPFDEPRTEEGQQDGNLRPQWRWAYERGWSSYRFNDDRYRVFDTEGRPHPPQVCIDFVTDALERASGTWWRPRDADAPYSPKARERVQGRIDFERLGIANRRSVKVFVDFAWANPGLFDAYDLAPEERIPFRRRASFFAHLEEHRERFVPGDIVTIHGLKSDGEVHYHSFIIYASDPVTGMPTLLAANAGRPRIRTWEQEMRSAPLRSIRSRIRPRLPWLESVVASEDEQLVMAGQAGGASSG